MILNEYGDAATFTEADLPSPEAGPGQVLVRVAATSVNTVDTMIRSMGEDLPFSPAFPAILSMDLAGAVEAVGEGVTGFSIGDEVYGCAGGLADLQGALAEYMAIDARLIAQKPKTLSMTKAAALPLVGITAYEGLKRAQVGAGQKVLVHGGGGGVGHVATQLARHFGADVFATGSGDQKLGAIRDMGATPINYREDSVADYVAKHTGGGAFDVVFDSVGGANMTASFEGAALNAQIATTVSMLELDLTPAHFKGLSIHVVFMLIPMLRDHGRAAHHTILSDIAAIVDAGALKPLLDDQVFAMADAGAAFARLSSGKAIGKVVIEIG